MKQQVTEDVNIMPLLDKACGFACTKTRSLALSPAIVAVARTFLKVAYNTLETLTIHKEKGVTHFVDLQAKAPLYYNSKLPCPQNNID